MNSNQQVSEALEQFSDWAMPWAYVRETLAAKGLTVKNAALVEEVWREANSSTHWMQPSFESGTGLACAALKTKYSWLSELAINNVVRGASYMWK
ncbi:hypothetical protein GJ699_18655 [Duganella sp. FT80W]|uniref:Uncharacterized protein n=1 Tax=Duganella guangzhouensis TaxID=2666084 RepID=A0A6I2L1F1_9BURK|nr:hypothetical protein [Duganella guangzhouensis]MRW92018.1 hypothetical protein [Duganella guangzhouensis]